VANGEKNKDNIHQEQCTAWNAPPEGTRSGNYYKKGLPREAPSEWHLIDVETEMVKSGSFIRFLESQGISTSRWRKVMEKYGAPDGTIYQRHYWTNGRLSFFHDDLIPFIPH